MAQCSIAVIIPCLNEKDGIRSTVERIFSTRTWQTSKKRWCTQVQVIICDGGSTDGTAEELEGLVVENAKNVQVTRIPKGGKASRGVQLCRGVELVRKSTDVLLFLHADTWLPIGWDAGILMTMEQQKGSPMLGCFRLDLAEIDEQTSRWTAASLRLMILCANIRAHYFQLPYGDQAYFVRRSDYEKVGGFAHFPIMEDVDLLRRYRRSFRADTRLRCTRHGTAAALLTLVLIFFQWVWYLFSSPRFVYMSTLAVRTSPRRWLRRGVWRNTLLNQICMTAFMFGISPEHIYHWYYSRVR